MSTSTKTSSAKLQHIFPGLPKNCSESTTRSDLLGTTRRRQGQQQECPRGEGPRRSEKCPSKKPSKSTAGEY